MWILFSVLVVSVVCANIDDVSVEISTELAVKMLVEANFSLTF